ncbi:hypothetical protein D1AOALGA4SA_8011 [Olavius algarvensis Delta 1 endosymbiont]|nr:hypothetical protein D1AOALGA4SA_8011 [Olavius algarvensis Delta 1 endosymbiont]
MLINWHRFQTTRSTRFWRLRNRRVFQGLQQMNLKFIGNLER